MTITATSNTSATVTITGTATSHLNANDVANLTITWLNVAFTAAPAANITDYNKSDFVIDFADPASIVYAGSFTEPATNDGSVTGSRTATLTGDTFTGVADGAPLVENTHYTVANVPRLYCCCDQKFMNPRDDHLDRECDDPYQCGRCCQSHYHVPERCLHEYSNCFKRCRIHQCPRCGGFPRCHSGILNRYIHRSSSPRWIYRYDSDAALPVIPSLFHQVS